MVAMEKTDLLNLDGQALRLLLTIAEAGSLTRAAEILELSQQDVHRLIQDRKLTAFKIGDAYLRFQKDQVYSLEAKNRINAELFPEERMMHHNVSTIKKATIVEKVRDYFYFNDFYILSFLVLAALLYLILSSQ